MQSITIIRKDEWLSLPNGIKIPRPTFNDISRSQTLTRKQAKLWDELQNLPSTEKGAGRALSIKRQVGELELKKHRAHQIINAHHFPEEYAKVS